MASSVQPVNREIRFFDPSSRPGITYTFAIIAARYQGQWIWVRHKDRTTWELPAGHLEPGESPMEAAKRELFEETGALDYSIDPIVSYKGIYEGKTVYGMIFLAKIFRLGPLPGYEITEREFFQIIPEQLTYASIQPVFFNYVLTRCYFDDQLNPSSR
ncbi:MAG: NUDIX domain-containing protein [Bacteroidales bacterium]|jgi:8-oxo-dGTP diphosphatase